MKVRYVDFAEDYNDLCEWWIQWDWPAVPVDSLPNTGLIVENEGVKICAAFIYRTDSDICSPEWYISNKEAPRELRKGAIEFLIEAVAKEAKAQGFKKMFMSVEPNGPLLDKLLGNGFDKRVETKMVNMVKVLE